jgi:serine/threonine-protein kinase
MGGDRRTIDPGLVGRRFGSYVVEELIGSGGMGSVWLAVQPEIGKKVAIKFLSPKLSAHDELVQRFFAEARAVNLIQHDNIVDIFDFGHADGMSWFVMEWLRGRSLEALLQSEGRLSVGRALDIAMQVADAIAAAHARQIVHRDLKADNIFLVTKSGRDDFVKLLDFGIAKLSDPATGGVSRTMSGAILGTPGYMSPEQGTGGTVDHRTDIYALGVLVFRMLAGQLPFEGAQHLEILNQQLTQEPPDLRAFRPDVSPSLAALVRQMLAKMPAERPRLMAEVLARLQDEMPPDYGGPATGPFRRATSSQPMHAVTGAPTTLSGAAGQRPSPSTVAELEAMGVGRFRTVKIVAGLGGVAAVAALAVVLATRASSGPTVARPKPATPTASTATPASVQATPAKATTAPPALPSGAFSVLIETDPPGATVLRAGSSLGTTPARLAFTADPTLIKLRMAGYGDEDLEIARDTEHAIVRMHKSGAPAAVSEPPKKPPKPVAPPKQPASKKPSIGLDD